MVTIVTDEQLAALTVDERIALIYRIEQTLPDEIPNPLPEWHLKLIAERLAHSEANPGNSRPWREVMEEIQRKRS
jgi:putative addiction module component (TIGR02574 family)